MSFLTFLLLSGWSWPQAKAMTETPLWVRWVKAMVSRLVRTVSLSNTPLLSNTHLVWRCVMARGVTSAPSAQSASTIGNSVSSEEE